MSIANGLALPNPLSNGTTADAVPVMADFNYLLGALNRALLDAGGGSGMNAQNTQIHNLASGSSVNDAVNLAQLQTYLPLGGGTLTGGLNGTTLSLSSTLNVSGTSTLSAISAAAISGTTLNLSANAAISGPLLVNALVNTSTNPKFYTYGGSLGTALNNNLDIAVLAFACTNGGNLRFWVNRSSAGSDWTTAETRIQQRIDTVDQAYISFNPPSLNYGFAIGTGTPAVQRFTIDTNGAWNFTGNGTIGGTLGVSGAATLAALTASGLITGNAGFSGTTLSLSGAATIAALTASGLITGNAGFSGTSLALSTTLNVTGQSTLGNVTGTPNGTAVNGLGYLGAPQNLQTVNYTLALSDMGKSVDMNGANLTLTVPANSSVAFPVGAILVGTNLNATNLTIAITTDTMTISGTTSTGSRTIGQNGEFRLKKTGTTSWLISGTNMT